MEAMRIEQHHVLPKLPKNEKKREFVLHDHRSVLGISRSDQM